MWIIMHIPTDLNSVQDAYHIIINLASKCRSSPQDSFNSSYKYM